MNLVNRSKKLVKYLTAFSIGGFLAVNILYSNPNTGPLKINAEAASGLCGSQRAEDASGNQISTAVIGQTIYFKFKVCNNGSSPLTNILIANRPPNQLTYVAGSSVLVKPSGTFNIVDNWIDQPPFSGTGINAGTLQAGQEMTLTYRMTLNSGASSVPDVENTIQITSDQDRDPSTGNHVWIQCAVKFNVSQPSGRIGDFVWNDLNSNGIQDAGEPGISGVTLTLKDSNDVTLNTTTTNGSGIYQFTGLNAGTYKVVVTNPGDFNPTTVNASGSNSGNDSNPSPATVILPTSNSSDLTIDFGFKTIVNCTGSIGDFVWNDLNSDGIQDSGEPSLAGVTVTLKNAAGATLATTTTSASGGYQFTGLCAGTYTVEVSTPSGFTPTTALVGADRTVDSNGSPATVVLAANNSTDLTIDFGFKAVIVVNCTGTVGDFVWNDLNSNGIQEAGEQGLSAVTVKLKNSGGSVLATTTTNGSGIYQFGSLCAGTYLVEVDGATVPSGMVATTTNASGSTTSNDSNSNPATVVLAANNSSDLTIDFGFKTLPAGTPNLTINKKIRLPNGNEVDNVDASTHLYVAGEEIIYRLFVTNNGTSDAQNVTVQDLLPPYIYWISGDGSYNSTANRVDFTLGTLRVGESRTLTYTAKVRDNIPSGQTTQENVATVYENGTSRATDRASLVIGKLGAILAASVLPQTGAFPPSLMATLSLVVGGIFLRMRKIKKYKYWS